MSELDWKEINISDIYLLLDCIMLSHNIYNPVTAFMNKAQVQTVLTQSQYNSSLFPTPLLFPIDKDDHIDQDLIHLTYGKTDIGFLRVTDEFELDQSVYLKQYYGTTSIHHPGVKIFKRRMKNKKFLAGSIESLNDNILITDHQYVMTPTQLNNKLQSNNYINNVMFMVDTIPHRVHEYIVNFLLEYDCVVIGLKYKTDQLYPINLDTTIKCWNHYINKVFPSGKVILVVIPQYKQYCGPRERLLDIIISKNYGITEFVNGPDNSSSYYGCLDSQKIADIKYSDHSVNLINLPIFAHHVDYGICSNIDDGKIIKIEGTIIRKKIKKGLPIPDYYLKPELMNILQR